MSQLHPDVQNMLDALYASDFIDFPLLTPDEARQQSFKFSKLRIFPESIPQPSTTDHIVTYQQNDMLCRLYEPENCNTNKLLVYYHGGGYVVGNVEQYDTLCRWLADRLNMRVISVDYPLSPECAFPDNIEAAYTALTWVADNMRYTQLIVAGDSAGGHMAAMMALLARDRRGPDIHAQCLFYPWCNSDTTLPSYSQFAEGYGLSAQAVKWFLKHYQSGNQQTDYPAFPQQFKDLSGLPKTFILCGDHDVLLDENKHYATALKNAGNAVHFDIFDGMVHGFLGHYSVPASFALSEKVMRTFKQWLDD
jgi:acetyl esterase